MPSAKAQTILKLIRTKQYRSINCLFKSIKPLCCLEQCSSLESLAANDHWILRGYSCLPNYLRTWSSLWVVSIKKENQSNVLYCALKWLVYGTVFLCNLTFRKLKTNKNNLFSPISKVFLRSKKYFYSYFKQIFKEISLTNGEHPIPLFLFEI